MRTEGQEVELRIVVRTPKMKPKEVVSLVRILLDIGVSDADVTLQNGEGDLELASTAMNSEVCKIQVIGKPKKVMIDYEDYVV